MRASLSECSDYVTKIQSLWLASETPNREALAQICENENLDVALQNRIVSEFCGLGPLDEILFSESITEILINSYSKIWIETSEGLVEYHDYFWSPSTYRQIIERMLYQCGHDLRIERPYVEARFAGSRLTVISSELTHREIAVSIRRFPKSPWTLEQLQKNQWAPPQVLSFLQSLMKEKKNFLVVGPTGSGKTSLISALLMSTANNERSVIIEDTDEIPLPNEVSLKILTRSALDNQTMNVQQSDLIKRSLRLRPDRIVVGEVRGEEAKDLLLALSTGHAGSFGSLHAADPYQALYRLETLVQMGAPQWSLQTVRRLIQLGIEFIVVLERDQKGLRKFKGAFKICSLEEHGLCLDQVI